VPALSAPLAIDAVRWLLESDEPAVRYRTLTELLDRADDESDVLAARMAIPDGRVVRALLADQGADGTFGVGPYRKWTGGHWRLVSLADLRYPPGDEQLRPVIDAELRWATRHTVRVVDGRARRCASQEGNAIGACCRLGFVDDDRISTLVQRLIECQWPDGGWNCDARPEARHSSFHESITPLWGLSEYRRATGDARVVDAIERAAEMVLRAGLFRSERRREALWPHFGRFRYPPYWHYDILFGLRVLADVGIVGDSRAAEALDIVEEKRRSDGRWTADGAWWQSVGGKRAPEAVDWGRSGHSEMVTFHALRVLKMAGRV
jgi:hypothetical protein